MRTPLQHVKALATLLATEGFEENSDLVLQFPQVLNDRQAPVLHFLPGAEVCMWCRLELIWPLGEFSIGFDTTDLNLVVPFQLLAFVGG